MPDPIESSAATQSRHVAKGLLATFSGRGANVVLRFFAMLVLARFISPSSYGLFGIVSSIHILLGPLAMLGLDLSTVQRKSLPNADARRLFWASTVGGLVLTTILLASAPLLSLAFREPQLGPLFQSLSPIYLITGIATVPRAILQRNFRFRALATIDLLATAASLALAIFLAIRGQQAWALIWMTFSYQVIVTAGSFHASKLVPGLPQVRLKAIHADLRFGLHVALNNLLFQASRRLDNILLGATSGMAALGQYTRAYSLFLTPISNLTQPLSSVAIPSLSRSADDKKAFGDMFTGLLSAYCWITPSISLVFLICSDELVSLALGDSWREAGPILQLLTIGSIFIPIIEASRWALIASGHSGLLLRLGVLTAASDAGGVVVGTFFGPRGVALGLSIAAAINAGAGVWMTTKEGVVRRDAFLRGFSAPYFTLIIAGLLGWLVRPQLVRFGEAAALAGSALVMFTTAALGAWRSGALSRMKKLLARQGRAKQDKIVPPSLTI